MEYLTYKIWKLTVFILLFLSFTTVSEEKSIALITPDTPSPAYKELIDGILEHTAHFNHHTLTVNANNFASTIESSKMVIAIGNTAAKKIQSFNLNNMVLLTGFRFADSKLSGVSLSLHDQPIVNTLKNVVPDIKTIHMADLKNHEIRFSHENLSPSITRTNVADNEKKLIQFLWKTINHINPKTDAVWINTPH